MTLVNSITQLIEATEELTNAVVEQVKMREAILAEVESLLQVEDVQVTIDFRDECLLSSVRAWDDVVVSSNVLLRQQEQLAEFIRNRDQFISDLESHYGFNGALQVVSTIEVFQEGLFQRVSGDEMSALLSEKLKEHKQTGFFNGSAKLIDRSKGIAARASHVSNEVNELYKAVSKAIGAGGEEVKEFSLDSITVAKLKDIQERATQNAAQDREERTNLKRFGGADLIRQGIQASDIFLDYSDQASLEEVSVDAFFSKSEAKVLRFVMTCEESVDPDIQISMNVMKNMDFCDDPARVTLEEFTDAKDDFVESLKRLGEGANSEMLREVVSSHPFAQMIVEVSQQKWTQALVSAGVSGVGIIAVPRRPRYTPKR